MKLLVAKVLPGWLKSCIKSAFTIVPKKFNRNYFTYEYDGESYRIYYTESTFGQIWELVNDGEITTERIPLSILDVRREVDAVIDIGAHFGTYSVLLKQLNPEAELYTFEPNKNNRDSLKKLLTENDIEGNILNEVVSDKTGTVTFYTDSKSGSQQHSTMPKDGFASVEKSSLALSDLIKEKEIDSLFLKIDAEGEELAILQNLFTTDIHHLEGIVEIHPDKLECPLSTVTETLNKECTEFKFISNTSPDYKYRRPMYYFLRRMS